MTTSTDADRSTTMNDAATATATTTPTLFGKIGKAFADVFGLGAMGPYGQLAMPATFAPSVTYGSTGARTYGGYPDLGEKNKKLIGTERYRTYDNLVANTDVVGAGVRLFLDLLAGADWDTKAAAPKPSSTAKAAGVAAKPVAPAGAGGTPTTPAPKAKTEDAPPEPTAEAKKYANLIRELLLSGTKTLWQSIVRYQGGYRFYDFRTSEITYARRDNGLIGVDDISPRPNHTITHWSVDRNGNVDGVVQLVPQTMEYVPLPRGKLVLTADNTVSSNPEGMGLLRHCIDPANRLQRYLELEGIGFETTLEGMPIGRAPYRKLKELEVSGAIPGFKSSDATKDLENLVENKVVTRKRGIVLESQPYTSVDQTPSNIPQFDLTVVKGEGQGQEDIAKAIERSMRYLAIILAVEHLLLGGDKGAYNLAKDKSDRLVALINSTLKELAAAFKRDVVIPLMKLNGWPVELAPDLVPSDVSQLDVDLATTALLRLAQAGDILGSPTKDKAADTVRRRAGLPERPAYDPAAILPPPPANPNDPLGPRTPRPGKPAAPPPAG
jgi:hypothetical protein